MPEVSLEVHAALVGGALGGLVVLVGVLLAEALQRCRDRRDRVERAAQDLTITLPYVVLGLSESPPKGLEPGPPGSNWWEYHRQSRASLNEIRAAARGCWKMKEVRTEVQELAAKVAAAEADAANGRPIKEEELNDINLQPLWELLFPGEETLEDRVRFYRKQPGS